MVDMSYRDRVARRGGKAAEPKVVRNRYPGVCACGAKVPAGAGIAHLVGSVWEVECAKCSGATDVKPISAADRERLKARLVETYKAADNSPHFAPTDGRCFYCKGDIIAFLGERYGEKPITGCPMCSYSYCE